MCDSESAIFIQKVNRYRKMIPWTNLWMINLYQIVNANPISLVFPQYKVAPLVVQNSVRMYGMVVIRGFRLQVAL